MPIAAPATLLGIADAHVIAAATMKPKLMGFTLSRDILDLAAQVERLARFGVDLNQRKLPHAEKLQLRVKPRGVGGVLEICYRR
jgi:hypothetical protein